VNDFRDWEAIDTFARTFATLVSSDKQ
jgi:hypothetical protein